MEDGKTEEVGIGGKERLTKRTRIVDVRLHNMIVNGMFKHLAF
jgi:hypothetical protein